MQASGQAPIGGSLGDAVTKGGLLGQLGPEHDEAAPDVPAACHRTANCRRCSARGPIRVIRLVLLQQVQVPVDHLDQPDPPGEQVHRPDPAGG